MAQPQVTSGSPHSAVPGREPPVVMLMPANGVAMNRRRVSSAPNASAWIVQVVIVATSAVAFLDLYLLATSFHH